MLKDALKRRWLDGEFLAENFNEATSLDMSGMKWGDAEMTKLAAALEYCHAKGALANLSKLELDGNQIGDDGMKAFSDVCAKGALACTNVSLYDNPASAEAKRAVEDALKRRGIEIA